MIKNIRVIAREVKTSNKTNFLVYSTKINNVYYKVRFPRESNPPLNSGVYAFEFDTINANVKKSNKYYTDKNGNKKLENDTIWINKFEYSHVDDEILARENAKRVEELFDSESNLDLPF